MEKWRNFILKKMGEDSQGSPYPLCESVKTWGVWCKDIPFKLYDKVKEPSKRSWNDEHGDDEYIPADGLYMEAYSMKVEFGCKKMPEAHDGSINIDPVEDVRNNVDTFLSYLKSSGMLYLYSDYTRIGRQYVRMESVDDSATWDTDLDGNEFLVFSVSFKVNDPVTVVRAVRSVQTGEITGLSIITQQPEQS